MKHIDVYRSLALERDGQGRIRVDLDQVSSTVQLCIGRMYLDDMVDWAYRQHTGLLSGQYETLQRGCLTTYHCHVVMDTSVDGSSLVPVKTQWDRSAWMAEALLKIVAAVLKLCFHHLRTAAVTAYHLIYS